jgi:hypothetical protein
MKLPFHLLTSLMICCVALSDSFASGSAAADIQQSLSRAPAAELPARAASLVSSAPAKQRRGVASDVVTAALALSPGAAPAIAGAIAKASPDIAATAAGTAAANQPRQAVDIARAVVAAAPTRARQIVAAVCRAAPPQYREIASRAAQGSQKLTREILLGVAAALPELKPAIQRALAQTPANQLSTAKVLDEAKPVARTTASSTNTVASRTDVFKLGGTPIVGPPYVPYSGTTSNVTPSTSGTVPRGGRNYAAP